jgi:tetratricopeptide (TPR) repeat protein
MRVLVNKQNGMLWIVLMLSVVVAACSTPADEAVASATAEPVATIEATALVAADGSANETVAAVAAPAEATPPQDQEPNMQQLAERQRALAERAKAIANDHIATGKSLLEAGRAREALQAFGSALRADPTNKEAQDLWNRVSGLIGEPGTAAAPASRDVWNEAIVRRQQAALVVQDSLGRAKAAQEAGQHADVVQHLRNAFVIVSANPVLDGVPTADQLRGMVAAAEQAAESARRENEAARLKEIESINQARDAEERKKLEIQLRRLWDEATAAFERERFDDCETICADLLDRDPSFKAAHELKAAAAGARHAKADVDNITRHRSEWQRALDEVKSLAMPFTKIATFPDAARWREISARGPITLSRESEAANEADQAVKATLEGTMLSSVDWTDKNIDDAVRFLRNNTGINFVITGAVDEAMPRAERILNLKLDDISAWATLRHMTNALTLEFLVEDGMVKITTKEQLRKRKVSEFYDVRDLTAKVNNFPGIELNLNPSGFTQSAGGEEEADATDENRIVEVDRLRELIQASVDPTSWTEDAENTIVDKSGTLVVRQTPENQRLIRAFLADLRKYSGIQVQIESRFLAVENNFLQDVGVDLRGLGDNSGGAGVAGLGQNRPFDDFGLPGTNLPIGTDTSSGAFYQFGGGNGDVRGRTQNLFDQALGDASTIDGSGGMSLQWTYLDDAQLEAILRAVQKYDRVNTVNAPTLLVYNTQRANLEVTRQEAYIKDYDVEIAQASVVADPVVDIVREGVVLDVRPIVSNDRRFVTLELRPTVATLVRPIRQFSSPLAIGTPVLIDMPELRKESLKTTVVVPDGGTILLGGLKYYVEQDMMSGLPVLSDIPILSFFFSHKGKSTVMKDLIIMLRVQIIILEEMEPAGNG